jgi:hypothetical protein
MFYPQILELLPVVTPHIVKFFCRYPDVTPVETSKYILIQQLLPVPKLVQFKVELPNINHVVSTVVLVENPVELDVVLELSLTYIPAPKLSFNLT